MLYCIKPIDGRIYLKKIIMFFAFAALMALGFAVTGAATNDDKKVTICHKTSSVTNPFVTLTISENAVFGPGGHFNENGTTQAGHEEDTMGPCPGTTTTGTTQTTTTGTTTG